MDQNYLESGLKHSLLSPSLRGDPGAFVLLANCISNKCCCFWLRDWYILKITHPEHSLIIASYSTDSICLQIWVLGIHFKVSLVLKTFCLCYSWSTLAFPLILVLWLNVCTCILNAYLTGEERWNIFQLNFSFKLRRALWYWQPIIIEDLPVNKTK